MTETRDMDIEQLQEQALAHKRRAALAGFSALGMREFVLMVCCMEEIDYIKHPDIKHPEQYLLYRSAGFNPVLDKEDHRFRGLAQKWR